VPISVVEPASVVVPTSVVPASVVVVSTGGGGTNVSTGSDDVSADAVEILVLVETSVLVTVNGLVEMIMLVSVTSSTGTLVSGGWVTCEAHDGAIRQVYPLQRRSCQVSFIETQ